VLAPEPVYPGVIITARPVGMFAITDEAGGDDKILCVPAGDPRWNDITDIGDVPSLELQTIKHFFVHYKDLEPATYVKAADWADREAPKPRYTGPSMGCPPRTSDVAAKRSHHWPRSPAPGLVSCQREGSSPPGLVCDALWE
jgi:hypothetical protein